MKRYLSARESAKLWMSLIVIDLIFILIENLKKGWNNFFHISIFFKLFTSEKKIRFYDTFKLLPQIAAKQKRPMTNLFPEVRLMHPTTIFRFGIFFPMMPKQIHSQVNGPEANFIVDDH